mgnify:CR=1 FL=1
MMLKTKRTAGHRLATFAALAQAALLLFWGGFASAQEGNRLQDIQVQSLPGDRVELKLIMSETAPEPLDFTIENPARIALDLPNTALGMSQRRRDVNLGLLDTVLTAEANGRTRVVLNLESMVEYTTQVSGNTVTVTLGDADSYSAGSTQFASAPSSDRSYAAPGNRAISSVDFRRTRDGGGRVIVALTDPSTPVDIRQEGGRVVAVFKDTSLPAELMRRLLRHADENRAPLALAHRAHAEIAQRHQQAGDSDLDERHQTQPRDERRQQSECCSDATVTEGRELDVEDDRIGPGLAQRPHDSKRVQQRPEAPRLDDAQPVAGLVALAVGQLIHEQHDLVDLVLGKQMTRQVVAVLVERTGARGEGGDECDLHAADPRS